MADRGLQADSSARADARGRSDGAEPGRRVFV